MTDEFLVILQAYGHSVVPLIAWNTGDVVRTIELLDAELQRRSDEDSGEHLFDYEEEFRDDDE